MTKQSPETGVGAPLHNIPSRPHTLTVVVTQELRRADTNTHRESHKTHNRRAVSASVAVAAAVVS